MNNSIQHLIQLENAFLNKAKSKLSSEEKSFFEFFYTEDFHKAFKIAESVYLKTQEALVKAFWLHMICVISEKKYDLNMRQKWMLEWDQLLIEEQDEYILTAKIYHQAVTCYFESHFREAFSKFKQIKESNQASMRFRALALLHLGLIHALKNTPRLALIEFKEALQIAEHIGHLKLVSRIRNEIFILESEQKLHLLHQKTYEALLQNDIKRARQNYLIQRRHEIKSGLTRQVHSLHALLPALILHAGSFKKSLRLLKYVTDPAVKVQTLTLMQHLTQDHKGFSFLEQQIKDELGLETVCENKTGQEAQILGRALSSIEQIDVARFAKLLYSSKTISKEDICQTVFEIPYDPVIHDGRIYKLIHKFRNYFGKKDILVNRYGTYEINSKYRPAAS